MSLIIKDGENIMSIDLALEIAQHNAVTADLPEAGEFGRIADYLKWQPISTVPTGVDEILAADADGSRFVAWFGDGVWHSCEGFVPTQWMALPGVQS